MRDLSLSAFIIQVAHRCWCNGPDGILWQSWIWYLQCSLVWKSGLFALLGYLSVEVLLDGRIAVLSCRAWQCTLPWLTPVLCAGAANMLCPNLLLAHTDQLWCTAGTRTLSPPPSSCFTEEAKSLACSNIYKTEAQLQSATSFYKLGIKRITFCNIIRIF